MRFVNLQATSERAGKGQVRQLILRRPINLQSATSPVLALGDADTGLFQSADDVLEFATAGVSRFKVLADGTVAVAGNLVVNGTTTTVNSTTLTVDDKNIELGSVATPSDTTADGGGITLKGATDKTFNWVDSTDAWTSSEHINLASGKTFQLNGTAITSTAAELNLLNGVSGLVQADLTKLAAVNSTAAELNYTDGVTSAIQTQMNAKLATTTAASTYAPIASPTFTGNFTSVGIDDNADALAITIDSSERVGIGVTAPLELLHLNAKDTGGGINFRDGVGVTASGGSGILARDNSGDGHSDGLAFYGHDGHSFFTTQQQRMTIDSDGKVGIDETSPTAMLDVRIDTARTRTGLTMLKAESEHGDASDYTLFHVKNSESTAALVVTGLGKVGIGTAAPTAKLHVIGHSTLKGFIKFEASSDGAHTGYIGDGANMGGGGGTNDLTLRSADAMYFVHSDGTFGMVMDTDGKVGIANTAPAGQLHVDYGSGGYQVMSYSSGGYAGLNWKEGTTNRAYFDWDDGNNRFTWYAGGGGGGDIEMVLLENGNLGIGTTSPAELLELRDGKLRLSHSSASGYECWIEGTGGGHLYFGINIQSTTVPIMILHNNGSLIPGADNTRNLGSSSARWANIYSADLQLSNEGKEGGNEVDGSTGNWTVQEGDENLFVINRKTGKKFKIDLTEV